MRCSRTVSRKRRFLFPTRVSHRSRAVLINAPITAQMDAFIPYNEVEQNISKFPADKNARIFLYCQSGRMSAIAAEELIKRGYINIWNLDGGMSARENAGLPLIRK